MEITSRRNFTPNFQARLVAKTANRIGKLETKIDIWEVTPRDSVILEKIVEKTDMKKLMPDIPYFESTRWQQMLEIAVDDTLFRNAKTYLAVTNGNKPCGIMSIMEDKQKIKTSCVSTWPVEVGKRVKFAGKTLFKHLFHVFEDSKAKKIYLNAISDGPRPTVPLYQSLGFRIADKDRLDLLEINKQQAQLSCKKLTEFIDYTPVKSGENIDLSRVLDLD